MLPPPEFQVPAVSILGPCSRLEVSYSSVSKSSRNVPSSLEPRTDRACRKQVGNSNATICRNSVGLGDGAILTQRPRSLGPKISLHRIGGKF